ncbi:carbohydrate ABC transporter permease [Tabrizicola sp. BL-A-41-H6]|uniref:carbohydrate ABC transporter permease n=1 Tax=Tabrizicola sp. BL-A-41-H6 TaxID=3421107 RepID=UPI003D666BF5
MARPSLSRIAGYAALLVLAAISLLPVWVALKTALTLPNDFFASASSLVPPSFTLQNFARVLGFKTDIVLNSAQAAPIDFALALRNSVIYAGLLVTGQLFFSALAAYAFARLRFPGRDVLFVAFLSATMIPSIVLFIPNFVLIRELGLINTFAGMVAPNILMVPFAVFFLRQFFISSPKELEEAARLEGLSHFQIFWHIALPLQRGPMATLAILLSINAWNDFFWPFLVGRDESVRPLAVALAEFQSQTGQAQPDWTGLMAAVMLSIIPILFLLAFFGRRIVESLQTSGMK